MGKRPTVQIFAIILFSIFAPAKSFAQLSAHFETKSLDYHSEAGDCDFTVIGTPTCELYFQMGVFYSNELKGDLLLYPGLCSYDLHEDGIWNFPDQELSAPLPNGAGSAHFYFALFDDDPDATSDDDLLGIFLKEFNHNGTGSNTNNNLHPSGYNITSCDGSTINEDLKSNRFTLSYSVWFTDQSAPQAPGQAQHHDADSPAGWDNDLRLDFSWTPASDPHSGVAGTKVELEEDGVIVKTWAPGYAANSVSFCSSGCTTYHAIVNGSSYRVRQQAENGGNIGIDNKTWSSWSPWSSAVVVDTDYPLTTIDNPASAAWQNADFNVSITDSDSFLDYCEYRINGGSWLTRTCNTPRNVTVGTAGDRDCQVEGDHSLNICVIEGRSTDDSGNVSLEDSRAFSIDYSAETITNISAATESGGDAIAAGSWTQDRDPFFYWNVKASTSPIAGYSYAINSVPDCLTLEAISSSAALPAESLDDGEYVFHVRAIDDAGNCGEVASMTMRVDGSAESIISLLAYTEPGGEQIDQGIPQEDNTPYLKWESSFSVSPVSGYSFSTEAEPDCTIETMDRFASLPPLDDGSTLFKVRAVDAADNCGPVNTFEIVVQRPELIFGNGFEVPASQ